MKNGERERSGERERERKQRIAEGESALRGSKGELGVPPWPWEGERTTDRHQSERFRSAGPHTQRERQIEREMGRPGWGREGDPR